MATSFGVDLLTDDVGFKQLTREEEREAWERGDTDSLARSQVLWVMKLSQSTALKHGVPREEAFSIGMVSLARSIETFDPKVGRLSTYVARTVMWSVRNEGKTLNLSRRGVDCARVTLNEQRDQANDDDQRVDLETAVGDAEMYQLAKGELLKAIATLSDRERLIVTEKYMGGKTLKEIAKEVGVSKNRIAQIRDRAVVKLREMLSGTYAEKFINGIG